MRKMLGWKKAPSMRSSICKTYVDIDGNRLRSTTFKVIAAAGVIAMAAAVGGCDRKSAEGSVTPSIPVRSFSATLNAEQSAGAATQAADVQDPNSDYGPDAEV